MKVLMQNRPTYLSSFAGDSVQMMKTREYLIKLGVDVTIDCRRHGSLAGYDLVHLFNVIPIEDTFEFFKNAVQSGKKVVLSPIYWNPLEYLQSSGQHERFGEWWQRTNSIRQKILAEADLIFPGSRLELQGLRNDFAGLAPAMIVPNAADHVFLLAKPDFFRKKWGSNPYVLSVGRICRHKNQEQLIRAISKLNKPLICIGPINDGEYYQKCRRAAAGFNIKFIPEMPPHLLASAYAAARVHALVSWYDIPGLVSLEAALAGCRIVSTDRGSASEYLGNDAFYCDPGDIEDISRKISLAWQSPPRLQLKERIAVNYTWEITAAKTLEGYRRVLENDFSGL